MKHIERYRVNTHDTDINQKLSLTGFLRYMQETAFYHMESARPSYTELFARGLAFILSRMTVSIYTDIDPHDEIEVETWAAESTGYSFNRCYRILKDGSIVAEAIAVWCLTDIKEKRFVRVSDFENGYGEDELLLLDIPKRLHIPAEDELSLVGEYTVRYADADLNRHMNNTIYGDLFCGFLPDMSGKRVIRFDISYRSEAPLYETMKLYMKEEEEGTYCIRSVIGGKTNAEARIMTEDIK